MSTNKEIMIAGRKIGPAHAPYVIAEMSANHNGEIENALRLIELAKSSGADAIKLQTYRADTITIDSDRPEFQIEGGLWGGKSLYHLYDWAHTPWEWHAELFKKAAEVGITIFSSPFDNTAVDLLEDLNTPAYKIASLEIVDLPLIRYVASTGKPMIISTGLANLEEIAEAVETAREGGCSELLVLHCVSGYPAPSEDYNLVTMADIASEFDVLVGLSDHTIDNTTAVASVALGGCLIEKHLSLDRNGGGPDDSFSLEPDDLAALCKAAADTWRALGRIDYSVKPSEQPNLMFRRSLYVVEDIAAGQIISAKQVRSIRPGLGLHPKHLDQILGRIAKTDAGRGTPVSWELVGE